jgi:hypothetical protein
MKFDPEIPRWFWFRHNMIYAITKVVADKPHVWLPLNRDYKPLGIVPQEGWVDYDLYAKEYPTLAMRFARDPRRLKDVWVTDQGDMLWLYSDRLWEAASYYDRLRKLLEHKIS